jgi:hypothetical protein
MGEDARGFIMYLPDGFMSANLMVPGRTPYTGGIADTATPAELTAAPLLTVRGFRCASSPS